MVKMRLGNCVSCSAEFRTYESSRKFCSMECYRQRQRAGAYVWKSCKKCGQPKAPGRCAPCRTASKAINDRIYQENNRDSISSQRASYRFANRDRIAAKNAADYAANRDAERQKRRESYVNNIQARRLALALYKRNNPEKIAIQESRRRARKRNALGSFTEQEWQAVKDVQRLRCAICLAKTKLTIDHIIPISRGGSNYILNIQGLCQSCNSRKRSSEKPGTQRSIFDRPEEARHEADAA